MAFDPNTAYIPGADGRPLKFDPATAFDPGTAKPEESLIDKGVGAVKSFFTDEQKSDSVMAGYDGKAAPEHTANQLLKHNNPSASSIIGSPEKPQTPSIDKGFTAASAERRVQDDAYADEPIIRAMTAGFNDLSPEPLAKAREIAKQKLDFHRAEARKRLNAGESLDSVNQYLADNITPLAAIKRSDVRLDEQSGPIRYANDYEGGVVGTTGATLSYLGKKSGNDTLSEIGDSMDRWAQGKQPINPTFSDNLVNGIGSMSSMYVPGIGFMKGTAALTKLPVVMQRWVGAGAMAGIEAAAEADGVYKQLKREGKTDEEAMSKADTAFMANMALLGVTDKVAFFNDIKMFDEAANKVLWGNVAKKAGVGAVMEGPLQEAPQQFISNYLTGRPITEGAGEAAAIGSIIGGGAATVHGALDRPSQETIAAEQAKQKALAEWATNGLVRKPTGVMFAGKDLSEHSDRALEIASRVAGKYKKPLIDAEISQRQADADLLVKLGSQEKNNGANTPDVAAVVTEPVDNGSDNGAGGVGVGTEQLSNAAGESGLGNAEDTASGGNTAGSNAVIPSIDDAAHEAATSPHNDLPEPTQAQKEAGNYKKGKTVISGLNVSIENPQGSTRKGTDKNGKAWETPMHDHYGYITGVPAKASDKDHVDTFIKAGTPQDYSGEVYVVDQNHPDTGKFDEPKVLIGYGSQQEAQDAYHRNYQAGWKGMRQITPMSMDEFKAKLQDEKAFTKPQAQINGNVDSSIEPTNSLSRTASWVIKNKETGEAIMETFDKKKVDALNTAKYEAVPIQEYLASLSNNVAQDAPAIEPSAEQSKSFEKRKDGTIAVRGFTKEQIRNAADAIKSRVIVGTNGNAVFAKDTSIIAVKRALGIDDLPAGTVLSDGDNPFSTQKKALIYRDSNGMKKTHVAVRVEDGFGLVPKSLSQQKTETAPEISAMDANVSTPNKPKKRTAPLSLLPLIKYLGGINTRYSKDLTGEDNGNKVAPFLSRKNGLGLDDLATMLQMEHGYTNINVDDVDGGVGHLTDLIQEAIAGRSQYAPHVQQEREGKNQESEYRDNTKKQAHDLGIKTVARKFEDIERDVNAAIQKQIDIAKEAADEWTQADQEAADAAREIMELASWNEFISDNAANESALAAISETVQDELSAFERMVSEYEAQRETEENPRQIDAGAKEEGNGNGRSGDAGGHDKATDQGETRQAEEGLTLTGESNAEIIRKEAEVNKSRQEESARANAPRPEDFTLTGSNRQADVAAAHGAQDLFSQTATSVSKSEAPEHSSNVGVDDRELQEVVAEFNEAQQQSNDGDVTHVFDAPAKSEIVRLADKVKVYNKDYGWMTVDEAKKKIAEWKEHAQGQYDNDKLRDANSRRVVLSLFDLTGKWSQPWEEAGYQVYRFDIQNEEMNEVNGETINTGDINNFSHEFFDEMFGHFDGNDVYAILAATPCTDFAVSGARHFAAKDADGRTIKSVKLVHMTLATIEHFKPAVWAIENPVGRIEQLGGLPPWRLSFDPNHLGDPYTKKTLLWGRFNADLPIAPVEPTEGSKMHTQYGGKSLATKNARSATPEGFAYGFFMANNAADHPVMAIANKYDRLDRGLIEKAVDDGVTEQQISDAVDDFYYMDLDDDAANDAIRDLIKNYSQSKNYNSRIDALNDDELQVVFNLARLAGGGQPEGILRGILKAEDADDIGPILDALESAKQWDSMGVGQREIALAKAFGRDTDAPKRYASRQWSSFNRGEKTTLVGSLFLKSKDDSSPANDEVTKAKEALDQAGVTGTDKLNTLAQVRQGNLTADEVAEAHGVKNSSLVESHSALFDRVREGNVTSEEFKAAFESLTGNKDAVIAELAKMTKPQIFKLMPGIEYRYKNEKKDRVVQAAWRDMIDDFALGRSISYTMGDKDGSTGAIRKHVENTDDAFLADLSERYKKNVEERAAALAERAAGMENPQTLDDYTRILRSKMDEGMTIKEARLTLTPEQREQYDTLYSEKSRGDRMARRNDQKTEVRAAVHTTTGDIIETKHTKTGEDLFVVKAAERAEREIFNQWNVTAKRLGGWYSSFRGNGAVPGFQFKTRENAEAFLKYLGGDVEQAKEALQSKRDSYADDKSQTAVERLTEMADRLEAQADESLGRERKANTARRARFAASAEASANADKAMAQTMRNIAAGIENGTAKMLDQVRQKVQVELLQGFVRTAHDALQRDKYKSYAEQEQHKGERPTKEVADYVEFPTYTAYRSDLASLGRRLLEIDGTKKIGQRIMSVADDVTDAYIKFAKENLHKVSRFSIKKTYSTGGESASESAVFASKQQAEDVIHRSGFRGKAIVLPFKRGQNIIVLSPSEAIKQGIWEGDNDKRITLDPGFGAEIVESLGRMNKSGRMDVANAFTRIPWQFENAYDKRKRLAAMGIEQPAELRAAIREFIGLRQTPKEPDRIKELERSMIGRRNDGLDFFPTAASVADEMIESADIKEGMSVLEPSAGMGHIADRIREAGVEPDISELSGDRRELLEAKGYNIVGHDFLSIDPRGFTFGDIFKAPDGKTGIMRGSNRERVKLVDQNGEQIGFYNRDELEPVEKRGSDRGYDRIIMNPPFSDGRAAQHVRHAFDLLRPGGRIVALMDEGVFFRSGKKDQEFRNWLEQVGATDEKLEEGSFMDTSLPVNTGVNARMVVIDKPKESEAVFSRSSMSNANSHFYSQLRSAMRDAPDKIYGNAQQVKMWLLSNAGKLGVKKDEIQWTGITDWLDMQKKVSKQDALNYLDANGVQVKDVMLGAKTSKRDLSARRMGDGTYSVFDSDGTPVASGLSARRADDYIDGEWNGDSTKYSTYTVPGGTDYHELLLTLPKVNVLTEAEKARMEEIVTKPILSQADKDEHEALRQKEIAVNFRSSHFDQPNILAHVRFDTRTDADGNKVLFLHEIQSDWGQKGKKEGFKTPPILSTELPSFMKIRKFKNGGKTKYEVLTIRADGGGDAVFTPAFDTETEARKEALKRLNDAEVEQHGKIPSAPFVTDTKAWVSLAIKRMISYAAQNGYDKVAFITGQQAADLYDLSKQVDEITVRKLEGNQVRVIAKSGYRAVLNETMPQEKLADVIGKDAAQKIDPESMREFESIALEGDDIKVGGEGMRAFYDQIVPQVANDVLKKIGGGKVEHVSVSADGSLVFRGKDEGGTYREKSTIDQLGFTITPAMRDKVQTEGLPIFSRSQTTRNAYEARIDALFDGAKPNLEGVRVLDHSDILDMLGYGGKPVVLAEGKVIAGLKNHPNMTAEVWKKAPEWIDNPAAVFNSDTVAGRLVFVAPETLNGDMVLLVVEPDSDKKTLNAHLLLNAYDKDGAAPPIARWVRDGKLRYVDKKKFPMVLDASRLQLPSTAFQNKPGTEKILTEKNLSGYRKSNSALSLGTGIDNVKLSRGYGMSVDAASKLVEEIRSIYKGVPQVSVVSSESEIPLPEHVAKEFAEYEALVDRYYSEPSTDNFQAILSAKVNRIEGAYISGRLYLNADVLNEQRLREVFAHEAIGHMSIENMLEEVQPGLFDKLIRQVEMLDAGGNKYIRELAKAVDDTQPGLSRRNRAREIIAQIAERGDFEDMTPMVRTLWQKITDAIKAFAKLVFDIDLNDRDVRDIVGMANRHAKGEDAVSMVRAGIVDAAYSRGEQTNTEAFKRWFGDSKVVDAEGRPLVVYHGSDKEISAFNTDNGRPTFFSSDAALAGQYAEERAKRSGSGSGVYPTYLRISNPMIVDANGSYWDNIAVGGIENNDKELRSLEKKGVIAITTNRAAEIAEETGFDGVIIKNVLDGYGYNKIAPRSTVYAVFRPTQIKSAIGNNGEFSQDNQNILFSRRAEVDEPGNAPPEETRAQAAQRIGQDQFNRFRVLQDWLKDQGVDLSESADVYLAETLMSGRISTRKQDFRENQMGPLIKKTQEAGFSMEQIGDYLKAQHAPEANVRARELQGNQGATAYGVSDEEAKKAMVEFKSLPNFNELNAIAEEWRGITEQTKKILLGSGIISDEMAQAWEAAYSFYVPVKGTDDNPGSGTGKGLSVNGRQRQRMGHGLRDEAIIENILRDHERAISLDEKNLVGKALIRFALEAQNDDIITVGKPVKRKVLKQGQSSYMVTYHGADIAAFDSIADARHYVAEEALNLGRDKADFDIVTTTDPVRVMLQASPMLADNEVNVYVGGHAVRVQINDEIAARAYTRMGIEHLNAVLSAGRAANNWLSKAYTGYSPDFIFTNPIRDAIQGSITLTGERGAIMAAKIFTNYPLAVKELIKHFRKPGSSQIVSDYRAAGGSTGAAYLSDLERIGNDIQASYNEYAGMLATYKNSYDKAMADGKGEVRAHTIASLKSGAAGFRNIPLIGHFLSLMEHINAITENALRVATYHTLVQDGVSVRKAAAQAKNLMNFNRKGEISNQAGALYLFFNPNVQGSHVIYKALFASEHKNQARALAGMMVLGGYALAQLALSGDDDDKDKWNNTPSHVKDGNWVVMFNGHQFMLPLPYGYRVFNVLGNVISDYQHGADGYKLGIRLASAVFDNFSPIGNPMEGTHFPFQVLPTFPKMVLGPSVNENGFGNPVSPKRWNEAKPDSQLMNRATKGSLYAGVAEKLNEITGGSKYEGGAIDVSPETLKYWVTSLTGGAGHFVADMTSISLMAAHGVAPQSPRDVPIVRRFVREPDVTDTRTAFWDRANQAKKAVDAFSEAKKNMDGAAGMAMVQKNGALMRLNAYAEATQKMAGFKRDEIDRIRNDESLTLAEKQVKMKALEAEEEQVYTRFIKLFDQQLSQKASASR